MQIQACASGHGYRLAGGSASPFFSARALQYEYRYGLRFVHVIRLPACARVSRVSRVACASVPRARLPRCLFTGTSKKDTGGSRDTRRYR